MAVRNSGHHQHTEIFYGLSTDQKPTSVYQGSKFCELDGDQLEFIFDGQAWRLYKKRYEADDGSIKTTMTTALSKDLDSITADILGGKVKAAFIITPSDTVDLTFPTTKLYVGVAGDVKVDLTGVGTGIVFKSLQVGFHDICAKKIYFTDTTATNLVAVYHV